MCKPIAASQLNLMTCFYEIALGQSRNSFRWAIAGSSAGVLFFMAAIGFLPGSGAHDAAIYSDVGGGIVEIIGGINFVLYSKATARLLAFHGRLEQAQRFLLANSICQSLEEPARTDARSTLVSTIAVGHPVANEPGPRN
jgi:hypothetical protein